MLTRRDAPSAARAAAPPTRAGRHALRVLLPLVLAVVGMAGCGSKVTRNILIDLDKTADFDSATFPVDHTWDIKYSWDCSKQVSQGQKPQLQFRFQVFNADDNSLAAETPTLDKIGKKGKDVIHYTRAGIYYLRIRTDCSWQLQVIDTSK